jgi:hypothetical protein
VQRLLQPLQRLAADNCHLCRQTGSLLRSSSLFKQVCDSGANLLQHIQGVAHTFVHTPWQMLTIMLAMLQVDTQLAFEVPGQGLIAPHIAGIATV